jgi:preprotein translocase subunit SecE
MQDIETELKITKLDKIKTFFLGVRQELKAVAWPTQKELKKNTKLVILSTLGCGFCVYSIDLMSKYVLDLLRAVVKLFLT